MYGHNVNKTTFIYIKKLTKSKSPPFIKYYFYYDEVHVPFSMLFASMLYECFLKLHIE